MPRLIDTDLRTTEMVMGVVWVLVIDGIPGLTMRRIAQQSGISAGSLLHHFETRERMLRIAAHRTGRTLISEAESDSLLIGLEAFLPVDEETKRLTSAWLAWVELARSQGWLQSTVTDLRMREREALAHLHDCRLGEGDLDTLVALLHGLRQAVCTPVDPMPLEHARTLLMSASRRGVVADSGPPDGGGDDDHEAIRHG
jgi:AcrR family transcriptional regulator